MKIADNWEEQYRADESPVSQPDGQVTETGKSAKKESLIQQKARAKIAAREAKKHAAGTTDENKS